MNAFDIIGPVMVGPSSSHTAGAARLGYAGRMLLGEMPREAQITLSGSFADTGKGHGTDKAVIAGLMGMQPDDENIPYSLELAKSRQMQYCFQMHNLSHTYSNFLQMDLKGESGNTVTLQGASVGGGSIVITEINKIAIALTCENNTIVVIHKDDIGVIAKLTGIVASHEVNIAAIRCTRNEKGQEAITGIEVDGSISMKCIDEIYSIPSVKKCIYLKMAGE